MSDIKYKNFVENETTIEPIMTEGFLFKERLDRRNKLIALEKAITEKIYGTVRVGYPLGDYIEIKVYDFRGDFNYAIHKSFFDSGDTAFIVEDFLYHYREAILDRYLKKGGKR